MSATRPTWIRWLLLIVVGAALCASSASKAWAGATIDSFNVQASGSTFAQCGGVTDQHSDSPSPATGSGPFNQGFSIAPTGASAGCSDGSGQDSTSGSLTSAGTVDSSAEALNLHESSQGSTTAIANYTGDPETGECLDVGEGMFTATTVDFTIATGTPFAFSGGITGTQANRATYSLTETSPPEATIFDQGQGLSPSLEGNLEPGSYRYKARGVVSNDIACTVSETKSDDFNYSFNLQVGTPDLAVTTDSLPSGQVGSPYSATATAEGGTEPYSWQASGLPAGLSIDAASGQISGTPTAGGTAQVVLSVSDRFGIVAQSAPLALSIAGGARPVISKLRQSHRRWREGRRLAAISSLPARRKGKRAPLGTTFTFKLNTRARVTFAFARRKGKRFRGVGALGFAAHPGRSRVEFQGRLSRNKTLEPGIYKLTATAKSGGVGSKPRSLRFTIVR